MILAGLCCVAGAVLLFIVKGFIKNPIGSTIVYSLLGICIWGLYQLELVPFYISAPPQAMGYTIGDSFGGCHPDSMVRFPRLDHGPFKAYAKLDGNDLILLEFKSQWFGTHLWRISAWKRDDKYYNTFFNRPWDQPLDKDIDGKPIPPKDGRLAEHMRYKDLAPVTGMDDPNEIILKPGDPTYRPLVLPPEPTRPLPAAQSTLD